MATFSRETAKVQEVYYRRIVGPNKEKYERQPFNLVQYDDNSGLYIEPLSFHVNHPFTWSDVNSLNTVPERLFLDTPVSFMGITEIR